MLKDRVVVAALVGWLFAGALAAAPQFVQGPSARHSHCMAYDSARGVQVLAHGEDGKGKFDPASGVAEMCKVGTQMKQGEALMMIHYNDEKRLKAAMDYFKAAYRLAPKRPNPTPLVIERVA